MVKVSSITAIVAVSVILPEVTMPATATATTPRTNAAIAPTNAKPFEFPYLVQGNRCAASMIWYDIALSAAHCHGFGNEDPFAGVFLIGNHILGTQNNNVLAAQAEKQVKHPNYNHKTKENDFLVIKLMGDFTRLRRFIHLIDINSNASVPVVDDILTVVGYSYTDYGSGTLASNLQKVQVYADSQSRCDSAYPGKINSTVMFCASDPGCQGFSGGPIIDARGVQVGVNIWGDGCVKPRFPGVYSRISEAYSWIRDQICLLSSSPPAYCLPVGLTESTIVEGGSTTINFTRQGVGLPNLTAARVDWGDGSVASGTNISFTHKYLNDSTYTIKTNFSYSDLPTFEQYNEFTVRVNNAAPRIFLSGIPNTTQRVPYTVTVFITCSDAGVLDDQDIVVYWNDGSANDKRTVPAPTTANCNNLNFSHTYEIVGSFAIKASVKDSRNASATVSSTLRLRGGRHLYSVVDGSQDKNVADALA